MYVYWVYMYMCMYMYVFVSRVNTYLQIDTHDYQCIYVRILSIYVYVYVFVSCVYTYLHLTFRTEVLHCMRAVGTCVWHDSLCDVTHDSWLMTHDSWLMTHDSWLTRRMLFFATPQGTITHRNTSQHTANAPQPYHNHTANTPQIGWGSTAMQRLKYMFNGWKSCAMLQRLLWCTCPRLLLR